MISIDFSLLNTFKSVYVGFSGGVDSTALLHRLSMSTELRHKLYAIHINHQIHPRSTDWEKHCQDIAKNLSIPFISKSITLDDKKNLEESLRNKRYESFKAIVGDNDCLVTAHHLDDQAETLLLNLFRGSGVSGLGGMKVLSKQLNLTIIRPLLNTTKDELKRYSAQHQLQYIEDPANTDLNFRRNFIRHEVLPLISKHYPNIKTTLARNSRVLKEQAYCLDTFIQNTLSTIQQANTLELSRLLSYEPHLQSQLVQNWIKSKQLKAMSWCKTQQILRQIITADNDNTPYLLHDGTVITRFNHKLYCISEHEFFAHDKTTYDWEDISTALTLPTLNQALTIELIKDAPANLLKPIKISVRFRQGGEKIIHAGHHKSLKKLFQEHHIPPWQRKNIPLIYFNEELMLVYDCITSDSFHKTYGQYYRFTLISC